MNEQNITILNEKQDKVLTDIMEHIKDEMKRQNTSNTQVAIRFRNFEKTLLANAIIDNKKVKVIMTDVALIKEISDLKDIQHKLWSRSLFSLFYAVDNLIITKSLGATKILEYKKATKYLELDNESNNKDNECIDLITDINMLKNIKKRNINTIRIIKNNSLADIQKDGNNEMTIDCFNIFNDIIAINYQRTATHDNSDIFSLYMTKNDKFTVIVKDKLKASELYHKLSFLTHVLNVKFEFMKTISNMIYKILDRYIKTNENNILENHLIQNNLAGEIISNKKAIPISFDKAVNFQNQLNGMDEKPLNQILTIIEYKGSYIKAYQSKNYIGGTIEKEPHDISLIDIITDFEKTFGVNTFYYIRLTYNNCRINIKNTANGIMIEGISKSQLTETDIKKINQNKMSIEDIKIYRQKPTIKLKYRLNNWI